MVELIKKRTKQIALDVIGLCGTLPSNATGKVVANRLIRCGTSIGANYRAYVRAKSKPGFINKRKIVVEESDETLYWLELLIESKLVGPGKNDHLEKEVSELLAIVVASIKKARKNL